MPLSIGLDLLLVAAGVSSIASFIGAVLGMLRRRPKRTRVELRIGGDTIDLTGKSKLELEQTIKSIEDRLPVE